MSKIEILRALIGRVCPSWIVPSGDSDPIKFLQNIIDQVLPGSLGVTIEHLDEERIAGSCPFRQATANVAGLMHGATIFALGDTLAGALLWYGSDGTYYGVSASCSIVYVRPLAAGRLICRVTETARDDKRIHLVAQFNNETGERIARLKMQYAIVRL